jgi:ABC-type bacteriocin/lantibiotic exporter with double-glycine peptidase domain
MAATDRHDVRVVFTPTTPARLAFVERESINNKLVNALRTPGKQVVVYGYYGSGKTTLLENKLHQIYEPCNGCVRHGNQDLGPITADLPASNLPW